MFPTRTALDNLMTEALAATAPDKVFSRPATDNSAARRNSMSIVRTTGMATVVFAGSIGTIIEWYDFLIYGTAAALVFNTLFFPGIDPVAGTLAALATYSVGFVARPVGGDIRRRVPADLPADRSLGPDSSGDLAVPPGHWPRG
jgi:hypothetical protein